MTLVIDRENAHREIRRLPKPLADPYVARRLLQAQIFGQGMERTDRGLVLAGAILGGLAVAFGAFGAHAIKARLGAEALGWWETATTYQMWHALAILALGLCGAARLRLAGGLMVLGTIVFAATLYAMALGAPRWLGAITPLGGLLMIAGWAALAFSALRGRHKADR